MPFVAQLSMCFYHIYTVHAVVLINCHRITASQTLVVVLHNVREVLASFVPPCSTHTARLCITVHAVHLSVERHTTCAQRHHKCPTLYGARGAPNPRRVQVFLAEHGLAEGKGYAYIDINMAKGEHKRGGRCVHRVQFTSGWFSPRMHSPPPPCPRKHPFA